MTALVIHLLTCDGLPFGEPCPAEYGGDTDYPSVNAMREKATTVWGWHHTEDGRDLCPDCWKEGLR